MSIRNDIDCDFEFPEPKPLKKKLKDVLEEEVDKKYYLTDEQVASFRASTAKAQAKGNGFKFEPFEKKDARTAHTIQTRAGSRQTDNFIAESSTESKQPEATIEPTIVEDFYKSREPREYTENAPTIRADRQGLKIITANKKGYDLAQDGDGIDLAYPNSTTRRGRVGHAVAKTLPTTDCQGVLDGVRIRKLTPKECWRLMGFSDEDFAKAEKVNSNTQLYKQAGNSIVVPVLEAIINKLNIKEAQ